MQIRLTVVDPQGPHAAAGTRAVWRDLLVTAPAGTALAAVASALAAALPGGEAPASGPVVLYAGARRLDAQRCTLGEPPLIDGAVLSLGAPGEPDPHGEPAAAPAQLHVVAGPDAGGVHLLHGGQVRLGRSADADVPLDDPDVSRTHCAVTVAGDGQVTVADLGSTNGTLLDGVRVGERPVRFAPGALLRVGESALRLVPAALSEAARVRTVPDGEGCVRVAPAPGHAAAEGVGEVDAVAHARVADAAGAAGAVRVTGKAPAAGTHHARGAMAYGTDGGGPGADATHASGFGGLGWADRPGEAGRTATPSHGTDVPRDLGHDLPQGARRRGGLGAWARRLTGGRPEGAGAAVPGPRATTDDGYTNDGYGEHEGPAGHGTDPYAEPAAPSPPAAGPSPAPETWPDPAALLLTALGPGPRLWERGPGHPEVLAVRLGTADRLAPGGGALPAVPVTVGLREAGALGLAGPRERLAGLARAVLAQLAALHSPDLLEIVLISADRARPLAERSAEWAWLGWLPQLRPAHGQDCRLLLAHDREQAGARAAELLRRLEDHVADTGARASASERIPAQPTASPGEGPARRPSWALPDTDTGEHTGPYTVVVVDGDPGGADLRGSLARLAQEGPRAGIHVVALAETPAASPASPVAETYEAACAASAVFRECGAVALLSGDVATTLRLLRVAPGGPVGNGTLGTVDAVSAAWAERFARAVAPLRTDGSGAERPARVSAPLPQAARLLDELGLARATPASLMARWADAVDDTESLGGRAQGVLGAGPRGPVAVDLAAEGPHLLIEGPPGSGRTELLRATVASLASAERPDRLGIVLLDGRDGVTTGAGEGLRVCTDVPHVTTHLGANDPIRMREFAQSLSAELKRRAELLGRGSFTDWHTGHEVADRLVPQRTSADSADIDSPPSTTMRLRPAASRQRTTAAPPPLPRLVVVVDDLDALVTPALGSPGRPAAGSVTRALEAVARDGERLGVHLVAATAPGGRTAETEPSRRASLRVTLDAPRPGPDEPSPGRGHLATPDGRTTPFQAGRVTGRIPRTATLRPTVVPLDWPRMGDPPTHRPVRELGNGPTDLALLASALERAAREVAAAEVPSLL
ncbi:FHA domain-containing protein [Streptomyces sp. NPDC048182]|uniref:FHA domain-containing protein n=1 Tax=Streptomyces sp. NPDC048182 TaxID=3365507 RepID=UPI00371003D6